MKNNIFFLCGNFAYYSVQNPTGFSHQSSKILIFTKHHDKIMILMLAINKSTLKPENNYIFFAHVSFFYLFHYIFCLICCLLAVSIFLLLLNSCVGSPYSKQLLLKKNPLKITLFCVSVGSLHVRRGLNVASLAFPSCQQSL